MTETESTPPAEPAPVCPECDGTGAVDSGGSNPNSSWINLPCPACGPAPAFVNASPADALRPNDRHGQVPAPASDRTLLEAEDVPLSSADKRLELVLADFVAERAAREKLQRFKDWTHARLDAAGIPSDPGGPHSKEGCRIGDRMDLFQRQRDDAVSRVAELERRAGGEVERLRSGIEIAIRQITADGDGDLPPSDELRLKLLTDSIESMRQNMDENAERLSRAEAEVSKNFWLWVCVGIAVILQIIFTII